MPYFAFCISDDPEQPDISQGFVQAECIEDALVKLSDDRANVYPLPEGFVWPVEAGGRGVWCEAKRE